MSTATYTEYPVTEPVGPTVMTRGEGTHARWEPLTDKLVTAGAVAQFHAKNGAQVAGHHAARLPLYYGRVAVWSPVGAWKVLANGARWIYDADRKPQRSGFTTEEAYTQALTEYRQGRLVRAGMVLAPTIGAGGWLTLVAPGELQTALAATATVGLGLLGRPSNMKPKQGRGWRNKNRLHSDDFVRAIRDLRIPEVEQAYRNDPDGEHLRIRCGIDARTHVTTAIIRLCGGATASTVIKRWESISSSLDVHASQLVISKGDTGSQVIIKVHPTPASARTPKVAPVISRKSIVFHEEIPLGHAMDTEVGTQIPQAMLIVGASGSGKTELMRNITCAALRDTLAETFLWDGKGGGDYANLIPSLRSAILGDAEHDPESMRDQAERMIEFASGVAAQRSAALLQAGLPSVSPETPGFHTMVFIFDEAQYLGKHLLNQIKALAYKCRSTNIKIVIALQEIDGTVVEYPFASASCWRRKIVLKLGNPNEVSALLGNSAIRRGFDASDEEHQPGQAILVDNGLRRFQVTPITEEQQRSVVERRGLVEKLEFPPETDPEPVLETPAEPEPEPEGDGRNLFADIAQTREGIETFAPTGVIVERLASRYPGMTAARLKKLLKDAGNERTQKPRDGRFPCQDITCDKSAEGPHEHVVKGFYYDDLNQLANQPEGDIQ